MYEDEPAAQLSEAPERQVRLAARLEGEDFGRILSLSDGVFAFALTLLALTLIVPVNSFASGTPGSVESSYLAHQLQTEFESFLGYAFAFVMIGVWWVIHNRTFRYIVRYDQTLVWLNMAVLMEVAVTPFVMGVFSTWSGTQVAVALFAAIQIALGLTNTLLWDYARGHQLVKPSVPAAVAVYFSRRGYLTSAVFAVSIGVSFVSVTGAELTWLGTFVLQRFLSAQAS